MTASGARLGGVLTSLVAALLCSTPAFAQQIPDPPPPQPDTTTVEEPLADAEDAAAR